MGRGVLLDYLGYLESKGCDIPDPCTPHTISVEELDRVAKHEGVQWKTGDILFLRTGFVRWFNGAFDAEKLEKIGRPGASFIGVKTDESSKKWLWNHHFSAVASDTLSFEGEVEPSLFVVVGYGSPLL